MSDVTTEMLVIWDLLDPSGPAQLQMRSVTAREFFARDVQARYVTTLPNGTTPGPKVGGNKIIIDPR